MNNIISIRQTREERERRKRLIESRGRAVGNTMMFLMDVPQISESEYVGCLKIKSFDSFEDSFEIDFEGCIYASSMAAMISQLKNREKIEHAWSKESIKTEAMMFTIPISNLETISISITINHELKQISLDHNEHIRLSNEANTFFEFLMFFSKQIL